MQDLIINDSEYDLQGGFAWIIGKIDNEEFTVQACLCERKECASDERRAQLVMNNKSLYKKEINKKNDGMDDGICYDVNCKVYEKIGILKTKRIFYAEMRRIGIKIA